MRTFVDVYHKNELKCLVKLNLSRMHRSLLAKMLCGVFPLMLELGRYKNIDEDKRICLICDKNITEDECHFLLKCRTLKKIRNKYLPRLQLRDPVEISEEEMLEEEEENEEEEEEDEEIVTRRLHDMFNVANLKILAEMIEEMQEERMKLMTITLK